MTELLEKRIKEISEAVANNVMVQSDAQFLLQMLIQQSEVIAYMADDRDSLNKQVDQLRELLHDLNAVLKTAMHNGHHDLIQRVADVCKEEA